MTGEEILPTLRKLNERCSPPLGEAELKSVALKSTIEVDPETAIRAVPGRGPASARTGAGHVPELACTCPTRVSCTRRAPHLRQTKVETFDPTWMILVGAAGSGKTEMLSAAARLPGVHVVGSLTEAALLSGTPRKDTASGASGGLLREIGEHGILVLKDFGSILSMHREARGAVLAALREIYDGSWTRLVGVDGGRRLHWEGRSWRPRRRNERH